jgi:hypothetical protein
VDDQYLATVVRYNLDFLDLCPLLVDITILDAKGGNITTSVSAEPGSCKCHPSGLRPPLPVPPPPSVEHNSAEVRGISGPLKSSVCPLLPLRHQ